MKNIVVGYLLFSLLMIVAFILLSSGHGFGYGYFQWRDWYLESNLFVFMLTFFILGLVIYTVLHIFKWLFKKSYHNYTVPKSFQELHPYERLGVLWLLHAERVEGEKILQTFSASALLYPLIQSRLILNQNEPQLAREWLSKTKNQLFELAELMKIEVAFNENNYEEVLDRLEFLTVQPLSRWLEPVGEAYHIELHDKWLKLAQIYPWWVLRATHHPEFSFQQNLQWLQSLLLQKDHAEIEDQQLLYKWFMKKKSDFDHYDIERRVIFLKLVVSFELFKSESFFIATHLLKEKFIPEVFYIWLDQALNQDTNIENIAAQINEWMQVYPAQPSLTFGYWHILQRQNQHDKAKALLSEYPNDPYMAYLRLQDAIQSSVSLQQDLKSILFYSKQDFNFNL